MAIVADQTAALLVEMLRQNSQLTETVKALTVRVEALTLEVHKYKFADWLRQLMLAPCASRD